VKRLAWFALCWLASGAGAALAQGGGVSYSTWSVSGNMVTLRFLLPVTEAQRLMGVEVPTLTTGKLEDYLLQHETVRSAGGDCPAIDQGFDLGRVDPLAVGAELYGFEIFYRCQDPRQLVLRNSALFGRAPAHINFARIQIRGQTVEQLFTAQHQTLSLPDDAAVPAAGLPAYISLGFRHLLDSAAGWGVLLGALLLVWRRREVGYVLLALVGGYLLAITASATGWVLPRLPLVESFMGLLVALLGAVMTQREVENPRLISIGWPGLLLLLAIVAIFRAPGAIWTLLGGAVLSAGVLVLSRGPQDRLIAWPWLVAVFAFLDGFVLPAVLPPAQWPHWAQLRIMVGFDLGALLFDAMLLGVVIGAWLLVRARWFVVPRPLLNDVCAAALGGWGTFWLLSRLG
jgi:hypothetical protein